MQCFFIDKNKEIKIEGFRLINIRKNMFMKLFLRETTVSFILSKRSHLRLT